MCYCFEVVEHIPDPDETLEQLASRIKPGGTLLLSTPVADRWIEPYLTNPQTEPKYLYHIQAFNPRKLWTMLRETGFHVDRMTATDQGGQFFVQATWSEKPVSSPLKKNRVSIYVPSTPLPFDPDSVHKGHVGGSEEAVVYLAPELAKLGFEVTVFSPRPQRDDDVVVHAVGNVLWRDSSDFDFEGDHEQVLFWRCPNIMQIEQVKKAKYKKWAWVHDATYFSDQDGTPTAAGIAAASECYGAHDGVICLTKAHAAALRKWDGYAGSNIRFAMNGIRVSDFPELTPETDALRDPFKVVWGSSPDRGLHTLLALWPQVKAQVPQATLDVYYAWGMLEKRNPEAARTLKLVIDDLNAEGMGVTLKGGVSHDVLHAAYTQASAYGYSQTFYEIYMISSIKAAACGTFVLANNYGSLNEVVIDPVRHLLPREVSNEESIETSEGQKGYADALVKLLLNPPTYAERKRMSDWARKNFGWDKAALMFKDILVDKAPVPSQVLVGAGAG
jgi:glycosyltransferase involved in cell wall biosynthesis